VEAQRSRLTQPTRVAKIDELREALQRLAEWTADASTAITRGIDERALRGTAASASSCSRDRGRIIGCDRERDLGHGRQLPGASTLHGGDPFTWHSGRPWIALRESRKKVTVAAASPSRDQCSRNVDSALRCGVRSTRSDRSSVDRKTSPIRTGELQLLEFRCVRIITREMENEGPRVAF
jgi:hypothetical protein